MINLLSKKISIINTITKRQNQIILIALILLILSFFIYMIQVQFSNNNDKLTWNTSENTSDLSLKKILAQDSKFLKYTHPVKVMKISSNLYLIDLDDQSFCGIAGCVYSLYSSDGELFLRFVAHSYLPKQTKHTFIDVSKNDNNKYPCLVLSQADWVEPIISHAKYCYSTQKFQFVNQTFSNFQS